MARSRTRALRLLERRTELDRARRAALTGGSLLVLTGPAGIGKTALLRATAVTARARGATVLEAVGDDLEHALAYGVVRQLLHERTRGLSDLPAAAVLAAGALGLGDVPPPRVAPDEAAIFHGLNSLLAALAARAPVAVLVDDAQWADPVSGRWLAYLVRRRFQVNAAVLLGLRTGEAGTAPFVWSAATADGAQTLTLRPLTPEGVAELLDRAVASAVEPAFAAVCHELTGGNPFYTHELAAMVAEREVPPTAVGAARLRELAPPTVGAAVLRRLERLSPEAMALARACAVLGGEPPLRHAAAIADMDVERAARAADQLTAAEVLEPERPLRFVHPIVRAAAAQMLPTAERAAAHLRAADLLAREGADAARVAVHLVETEPCGDPAVVERLRAAAAGERAPDAAVRWLERALDEPPPARLRPILLLELGAAQATVAPAAAAGNLERALREADEPRLRAEAALLLMRTLILADRAPEAVDLIDRDLGAALESDDAATANLRWRVEANRTFVEMMAGAPVLEGVRRLARRVDGRSPAERALLGTLAYCTVFAGGTAAEAVALAERALAQGDLAAEQVDPFAFSLTIWALEFCDRYDAAERALARALAFEEERGSRTGLALVQCMRAVMAMRRGALPEAAERAHAAHALGQEHAFDWTLPIVAGVLIESALARGDLTGAEVALRAGAPDDAPPSTRFAFQLYARAGLRLAQRRPEDAAADAERGRRMCADLGHDSPGYYAFRSRVALASHALGDDDRGRALAADELRLARALGAPRAVGVALRTSGALAEGDERLAILEAAADALASSEARLEAAVALLDLGAAQRRAGRRGEARERLRAAVDIASSCGADAILARATAELSATGARSVRPRSGAGSLTPAEERVAALAAEGLANAQIARELFLSPRTVEAHLRQVFRKLGVRTRDELAGAL